MFWIFHKVHASCVHYYNAHFFVLSNKFQVLILYVFQIVIGYFLFVRSTPTADVLLQLVYSEVEINDQVGFRACSFNDFILFQEKVLLVSIEVVFSENLTFTNEIIAYYNRRKQILGF